MAARAALLAYLSSQLHPLAVRVGASEDDRPDGYAYALDTTLARFGVSLDPGGDGDLPAVAQAAARAVARYYGLQALQTRAAGLDAPAPPPGWPTDRPPPANPLYTRITAMMEAAAHEAEGLGWPVGDTAQPGFTRGRVALDYRRPRGPIPPFPRSRIPAGEEW